MKKINEAEAEILFEEHLRERGWDIADFTVTRKRFRDHLDGEEADRVFLHEGKVVAILEAKKPGRDLWAALEQAKAYARAYKRNTGHDVPLLFASDGEKYLRQNLKANTLPESIPQLPTPAEFNELFRTQSDFLLGDLRDYQRVAVSQVLAAVQAGRKQMYIQMATGTGKTITAAGIIAKLWSLGLVQRALFLVDRDALAAQTERAFRDQLGDSLTVRRATGDRDDRFADVLVTTVQHLAVHSKYETFPSDHFGLVFLGLVRTVARHKKHDFYLARKGDVIFNNTNSPELVGKTILFLEEDDFYFSNHLSRIRTTDGVTNEWLAGLLHVLWTKGVFRGMCRQWVNQASVSKESVFALEVPIPSPTALLNHREALEHLSTRRDGFAKAHDEAESLFSILLSHALTGELTAEWEAANADWIAERQVFYGRLPRLGLLSLLLERRQRAGSGAVTLIAALMKYAFLAQMEGELRRRIYRFVPYHYGPCAMELYADLKTLAADGLIALENDAEEEKTRITLTDPDRAAALLEDEARKDDARLSKLEEARKDSDAETDPAMSRLLKRRAEILETLRADAAAILDAYGNLDHNDLLKTVYEKYPAYAKKSRLRRKRGYGFHQVPKPGY